MVEKLVWVGVVVIVGVVGVGDVGCDFEKEG